MKVAERVELNLRIMMGKPVIRGTRIFLLSLSSED